MNVVDQRLVVALSRSVQAALVRDATTRVQADKAALGRAGQEALADSVLRSELQTIDEQRLADGTPRLTQVEEMSLCERVLALCVGLGPVELVLRDQRVEEIVATRFDLVFVYRSDGSVDADPALKANRLGLLATLHAAMNRVADLSKLAA